MKNILTNLELDCTCDRAVYMGSRGPIGSRVCNVQNTLTLTIDCTDATVQKIAQSLVHADRWRGLPLTTVLAVLISEMDQS